MEIELLPDLPREIIEAYEDKRLVLFVGAGISRLVGCKGWNELADELINAVFQPELANMILKGRYDAKDRISIAYENARHYGKEEQYWEHFKKALIFARGLCYSSDSKMTPPDQDEVIDIIHRCLQ